MNTTESIENDYNEVVQSYGRKIVDAVLKDLVTSGEDLDQIAESNEMEYSDVDILDNWLQEHPEVEEDYLESFWDGDDE